MKKIFMPVLVLMITTLSSCSTIAGIFKGGALVGIIAFVIVIAVIIWIISLLRSNN